ncbi:MAG: discoidin domain-containing protein, partial [Planctomycetota bacterium]
MARARIQLLSLVALSAVLPRPAVAGGVDGFRAQVEADWRLQVEHRGDGRSRPPSAAKRARGIISTSSDAAGAVDGVKNGRWGFHTDAVDKPWWHVDLGGVKNVSRVVIWNRCDSCAPRTSRLSVLLSDDGKRWRKVYTHGGTTFYGFTDRKPLDVKLGGQGGHERARFVRVQLPVMSYFHLDEVEVFGPRAPGKNLALGRPADQKNISQWSTASRAPGPALPKALPAGPVRAVLERCRRL